MVDCLQFGDGSGCSTTSSLVVIGGKCTTSELPDGESTVVCDGGGIAEPTETAEDPFPFINTTPSAKPTAIHPSGHTLSTTIPRSTAVASTISIPDGVLQTSIPAPSAASQSSKSSAGVSSGAVAGIAIATALIGAAIAFIVAFFIFKNRNRRDRRTPYESIPEMVAVPKDNHSSFAQDVPQIPPPVSAATMVPIQRKSVGSGAHPAGALAGIVPPPADEQAIRERFTHLFNQVQAHVDNYYRDVHANTTSSMEESLARFGSDNFPMVEALQNSSRPTNAIKRALAQFIMDLTSPYTGDNSSLFPRDVLGFTTKADFYGDSASTPAYLLYRRLSVYLYTTRHSSSLSPSSTPSSLVQSQIRESAEQFAVSFFAWANPTGDDQEKDEDLEQIIGEALDLQIWLFGEGFLYRWSWMREQLVGGMIVSPGLLRVKAGESEEAPRVVVEPRVLFD